MHSSSKSLLKSSSRSATRHNSPYASPPAPPSIKRAGNLLHAGRDIKHVDRALEQLQRRNGLIIRHLMPRLIDSCEAEIAILPRLALLDPIHHHGHVARLGELVRVLVLRCERDGLAPEPVADVVGIAVDKGDAHGRVEDHLEVFEEDGPDEVARVLEDVVDLVVCVSVVEIDADRFLHIPLVQVLNEVVGGNGVFVWVADVIDAAAAVFAVRGFDVVAAHVFRFGADGVVGERCPVGVLAVAVLIQAPVIYIAREVHIDIDCVIDCFDFVRVVIDHDGVKRSLDCLIDDAIDYPETVEVEGLSSGATICDHGILLVEVIGKCRPIVPTI